MTTDQFPRALQAAASLEGAAALALLHGAAVSNALPAGKAQPSLVQHATRIQASASEAARFNVCQQTLSFSFFFDGTGNNLEADSPTGELSNVAKLYLAHQMDDEVLGRYRFYVPGIGTYFKEIGDPGGSTRGLAFGAEGDKRLRWALDQFDEKLKAAEALAMNPTNKITIVKVAAFGFSRGATAARAFARMFQERCHQSGAGWRLRAGNHPVRFYFLGLWDTVASVGIPMSANNTAVTQSLDWTKLPAALKTRSTGPTGASTLAFGQPGADPAPGPSNGHGSWAHPLDVADMVEHCVHMVAAHEMRNSFPLDSCRRGMHYPACVEEMVYPGAHSDVGGGYRPGEGARSHKPGQMMSVIPLRAMHQKAWEAGVPLLTLTALPPTDSPLFANDEASQTEFNTLQDHWHHYMKQAGLGGRGIGQQFNAHMRLYYGWRFYKIRQNQAARARGGETLDQTVLRQRESQWRQEHVRLSRDMDALKPQVEAAQRRLNVAVSALRTAQTLDQEYGHPVNPALIAQEERARASLAEASDPYLKLKARRDTLPGVKGALAHNLNTYDDQLMADAQAIRARAIESPHLPVRPHYRNLLDAYEAEFVTGNGMRDERLIAFFDTYVHDSLASFGSDATLPSDPRVIYIGDNIKSQHSRIDTPRERVAVEA